MDEARAVLDRLDRIDALEREGAPAQVLLDEVRALLAEAETWVRAEPAGAEGALEAVERCRKSLGEKVQSSNLLDQPEEKLVRGVRRSYELRQPVVDRFAESPGFTQLAIDRVKYLVDVRTLWRQS